LSIQSIPDKTVPYNFFVMPIAEGYYQIGETEKGNEIYNRMITIFDEQLQYYFSFESSHSDLYSFEKEQNLAMLQKLIQVSRRFKQEVVAKRAEDIFDVHYSTYTKE